MLARIQSLAGVVPGLSRVEIHPAVSIHGQPAGYTMYFDTEASMQAYSSHPAYQAIRGDLHRLSPRTTVSSISMRPSNLTIGTDDTDGTDGRP